MDNNRNRNNLPRGRGRGGGMGMGSNRRWSGVDTRYSNSGKLFLIYLCMDLSLIITCLLKEMYLCKRNVKEIFW